MAQPHGRARRTVCLPPCGAQILASRLVTIPWCKSRYRQQPWKRIPPPSSSFFAGYDPVSVARVKQWPSSNHGVHKLACRRLLDCWRHPLRQLMAELRVNDARPSRAPLTRPPFRRIMFPQSLVAGLRVSSRQRLRRGEHGVIRAVAGPRR